jgi:hypothetical protein
MQDQNRHEIVLNRLNKIEQCADYCHENSKSMNFEKYRSADQAFTRIRSAAFDER